MKKRSYLGIDTSNYMTSICFIDENRNILFENKRLLEVKSGENGLQQSQALFQHVKHLPLLFKESRELVDYSLAGIAVSKAPRPEPDSYMPVFLAGILVAESMAHTFKLPLIYTTHQEGHIAAGQYSAMEEIKTNHFLAVHLSGGTSEIVEVRITNDDYQIKLIGGTKDLHAGQLIDRIGVLLGFPFPAGPHIEALAQKSIHDFERIPTSVKGSYFNLSGGEAEAKRRIIEREDPKEQVARAIEHYIAVTLEKALKKAIHDRFLKDILIVGGVAQNQYIRDYMIRRLEHSTIGAKLYFADKKYSGDNAYGVANIGLNQLLK